MLGSFTSRGGPMKMPVRVRRRPPIEVLLRSLFKLRRTRLVSPEDYHGPRPPPKGTRGVPQICDRASASDSHRRGTLVETFRKDMGAKRSHEEKCPPRGCYSGNGRPPHPPCWMSQRGDNLVHLG